MSHKGSRAADSAVGSLGPQLVGEKICVDRRVVQVTKLLGEGGYSFAYLVKDLSENSSDGGSQNNNTSRGGSSGNGSFPESTTNSLMVLKITSIHSRHHRDVAEKEAKLLRKLSHPSIVRIFDACYRGSPNVTTAGNGLRVNPQHMILMEYCDGGNSLSMINELKQANRRFDLPSLIIAFGQICNAVSYLHAQRPPIVHRDLKPVNFLIKNGAYKLGDFGSAVIGHVDLKTPEARHAAEEVVQKTTTQMFRSPEMVDLFMAKRLTQSTDIWALGCCLYSLAFFQNCFEEGSNLAILSCNFKIPEDNPYGEGVAELIRRMLTVNYKERADISEVILCLSALYSERPLPPRKLRERNTKSPPKNADTENQRVGTFRTDGQGIKTEPIEEPTLKAVEAKKLNPNSAASRRLRASQNVETKNSYSWEKDTRERKCMDVTTTDSIKERNSRTAVENLFSVNPFGLDDSNNRKSSSKEEDISFTAFESTTWKGVAEKKDIPKQEELPSPRKASSSSDVTHGIDDPAIGIEISIMKRSSRENLQGSRRLTETPVDADIEHMMRQASLLENLMIEPIEKDPQEKKKRFTYRIESNSSN